MSKPRRNLSPPSRSFFESEYSLEAAHRRAVRNKAFWMMVYGGNGLSYQELREMDMADYREAVEARILYNTEWTKMRGGAS